MSVRMSNAQEKPWAPSLRLTTKSISFWISSVRSCILVCRQRNKSNWQELSTVSVGSNISLAIILVKSTFLEDLCTFIVNNQSEK
jgi:hypothetical protein